MARLEMKASLYGLSTDKFLYHIVFFIYRKIAM